MDNIWVKNITDDSNWSGWIRWQNNWPLRFSFHLVHRSTLRMHRARRTVPCPYNVPRVAVVWTDSIKHRSHTMWTTLIPSDALAPCIKQRPNSKRSVAHSIPPKRRVREGWSLEKKLTQFYHVAGTLCTDNRCGHYATIALKLNSSCFVDRPLKFCLVARLHYNIMIGTVDSGHACTVQGSFFLTKLHPSAKHYWIPAGGSTQAVDYIKREFHQSQHNR